MLKQIVLTGCLLLAFTAGGFADDIAVTVYNSNLGVVSETRALEFQNGINQLAFRDVPSQIDPNSVRFELVEGDGVAILEQNYAFDLVSPDQIMRKYIDNQISLIDEDGNLYEGALLATSGGAVTLRDRDGQIRIVRMDKVSETRFPELPEGLITRPTLFWLYNSSVSGSREARVGYQTTGMNWSAEYVGVLNQQEDELNLSGWAAINNTSGKAYADATLKLIAGDIHRAQPESRGGRFSEMDMMAAKASPGFDQKAFFEYHLYTLPRKTTLANNEIKQISLFDPASTGVEKIYLYEPDKNNKQVTVAVEFTNSESAGLGMPLPAGRVRMFKADDDGSLVLLGEDRITHTPRNEELKLRVGYAFDIVAEEVVKEAKRISNEVEDRTFEISLRNRKEEPVTVTVEKQLYGFWDVMDAGFEYEKKDATTLTFDLTVPADTELTATYTVRFTRR